MLIAVKADLHQRSIGTSLVLALRQAGADVHLIPQAVSVPLPPDVADLLTKRPAPTYDLLIQYDRFSNLHLNDEQRRTSSVTVAWTGVLDPGLHGVRERMENFDLVLGENAVLAEALATVSTTAASVQSGYWPRLWPRVERDWIGPLRVCITDPDDVTTLNAVQRLHAEHPDIDITLSRINPELDDESLHRAFASQHLLIATPGAPAREFLSTGAPVIAAHSPASQQWLSPAYAYPLTGDLTDLLAHLAGNRDELRRKGETAADLIPQMCSWDKVIERLMDKVSALGGRGAHVITRYHSAKARLEESRQAVSFI